MHSRNQQHGCTGQSLPPKNDFEYARGLRNSAYAVNLTYDRHMHIIILEKWFPLQVERAHTLKLFCMYDKRFEISKTKK